MEQTEQFLNSENVGLKASQQSSGALRFSCASFRMNFG